MTIISCTKNILSLKTDNNHKTSGNAPKTPVQFIYLQLTKRYSRLIPHPESRIDRLTKRRFKLMNKCHGLRHIVKGKSASCKV